jgi:preprotein translocase subunit YajC
MYDQFFHTLCILYVYGGVTLVETCREDTGHVSADMFDKEAPAPSEGAVNTCVATCPHLYQALSVYVTTLEMFTFALILPLLFLPCVYLWIIRRASAEAEAFSLFQERLEEEEALLQNGGLTAQEIIDSLEKVKLISTDQEQVLLLPLSSTTNGDNDLVYGGNTRECCICMSDFIIQPQGDIETGLSSYQNPAEPSSEPENIMVRTKCAHVFHGACLAGWIGGRWEPNRPQGDDESPRRIARRTCCPLCREDLKPASRI